MSAKKDKIILLGGGGHARVVAEMVRIIGQYEVAGMVDPRFEKGKRIDGVEILGGDDQLPHLYEKGIRNIFISVGSVKDNSKRKKLYEKVKELGFAVPALIHPKSIVSSDVKTLEGVQVMAGAILQSGSAIGENSIINTGAIIEHDCNIGSHVHICPGAVISGEVSIGEKTFIGAGTTIIQGLRIGKSALVGAGAVVIRDVPDHMKVAGVPAK